MSTISSLSETLQNLTSKGYQIADNTIAPHESIQSGDWRLDSVEQIHQTDKRGSRALVIAVSSASRHLKLVFVEVLLPKVQFDPMTLLRRLFPGKNR